MQPRATRLVACALGLGLSVASAATALGQIRNDDPFQNANIASASPTEPCCGGFPAANIFGAVGGGEDGATTIFQAGGTNFVNFTAAQPVLLNGVTLFNVADAGAEDGFRGTTSFTLLADTDNNGSYETTVVGPVNPSDAISATGNTYTFAPIESSAYRAEFVGNGGNRILELDAIGQIVPEPASLSVLALGGLGLLARRRRD